MADAPTMMQAMSDVESSFAARTSDVRSAVVAVNGLPRLRIAAARAQAKDRVLEALNDIPFTPTQGVRSPSPRSPSVCIVSFTFVLLLVLRGGEPVKRQLVQQASHWPAKRLDVPAFCCPATRHDTSV